jgi:hypothetical protein
MPVIFGQIGIVVLVHILIFIYRDRVLPLRHLPGRLHADNDVYCLLDMDNSPGGKR